MNLPQNITILAIKPRQYRLPRKLMLYLLFYALAIVIRLLLEEEE